MTTDLLFGMSFLQVLFSMLLLATLTLLLLWLIEKLARLPLLRGLGAHPTTTRAEGLDEPLQLEDSASSGGTEKQDPVKTHTILVYEKQDGTIGLGLKYHDNDNFIAAIKEDKDNVPYTPADKAVDFMLKIAIAHFDNLTEFVSPTGELLPVTRDEERGVVLVGKGDSQDNPSKINNLMDFSGGAPSGGKH